MPTRRTPTATYRLQFSREFRFPHARALVDYLHRLGVTDIYASPLLQARSKSRHGYDCTDPARLDTRLGGEKEFGRLSRNLKRRGMGLVLDIVPNHMAASHENPWWMDVLENGPSSAFARYFDIDWRPDNPELAGKVLLPVLGRPYPEALESGELKLLFENGNFFVRYFEHRFPLALPSYSQVLRQGLARKRHTTRSAAALQRLAKKFEQAARQKKTDPGKVRWLRAALARFCRENNDARRLVQTALRSFKGRAGKATSFDALDRLLERQFYRLAHWRRANQEINYRRFFDNHELVCLRAEDPQVFESVHALLARLVARGLVTGVRVDHVDGLRDPLEYLRNLQKRLGGKEAAFYIAVEKILSGTEKLPRQWPVSGTTGYDFLNLVNGLFVDSRHAGRLRAICARFTGQHGEFADLLYECKTAVMQTLFAGEMKKLTTELANLATGDPRAKKLPPGELERALVALTACLPVYRTYSRKRTLSSQDRRALQSTLRAARGRNPDIAPSLNFLARVLRLEANNRAACAAFVLRWQQFTGPVMAKGFEDTALYNYHSLISLNDVGGAPDSAGVEPADFLRRTLERGRQWPLSLNATSTHDTKRSEDVRARINVLSEIPATWEERVKQWSKWNAPRKRLVDGKPAPNRNDEYLLYQTLTGAWPLLKANAAQFRARVQDYMLKAAREAKANTSWIEPNAEYEAALKSFIGGILSPRGRSRFLLDLQRFLASIERFGALNSLAQTLLKIVAPGVPDFYQGTELWDFSLVDPDNRRPVDFGLRRKLLAELESSAQASRESLLQDLLENWRDGRIKLYLTWKALTFRRSQTRLFAGGAAPPVRTAGGRKKCVCALARRYRKDWAVAVIPRLPAQLTLPEQWPLGEKVWKRTALLLPKSAPAQWKDVFTGRNIEAQPFGRSQKILLADVFKQFPVALLTTVRQA